MCEENSALNSMIRERDAIWDELTDTRKRLAIAHERVEKLAAINDRMRDDLTRMMREPQKACMLCVHRDRECPAGACRPEYAERRCGDDE